MYEPDPRLPDDPIGVVDFLRTARGPGTPTTERPTFPGSAVSRAVSPTEPAPFGPPKYLHLEGLSRAFARNCPP